MSTLKILTAILGTTTLSLPTILNNKTINQLTELNLNSNLQEKQQEILNFDDCLRQALYFDYLVNNPESKISQVTNINSNDLIHDNAKGSISGSPSSQELPYGIYFGESTFTNNFDIAQTFSTPSFTKTVENTFTSSVTYGISDKTSINFSYFNFSFEFSYSKTDTKTQTTSQSFISPIQNITVPPHKSYNVTIYMAASQGNANVNLEEDISGQVTANITDQNGEHSYTTTVGKAFQSMQKYNALPKAITIKNDNTVHFNGLGSISSFANKVDYNVKIDDITKK